MARHDSHLNILINYSPRGPKCQTLTTMPSVNTTPPITAGITIAGKSSGAIITALVALLLLTGVKVTGALMTGVTGLVTLYVH